MKALRRSSRRVKAKSSWGSLPLESQMHILSLLPVEDIQRSRVVCKHWASLLHDPHFKSLWAQNSRNRTPTFVLLEQRGLVGGEELTRYYKYPSGPCRLSELAQHWSSWLTPEGSKLFLSAGGLLACTRQEVGSETTHFSVGNPLTQQWVNIPPLQSAVSTIQTHRSCMFTSYTSEGSMFFRIAISPYFFDSKVGIWTVPPNQTMWMFSYNTLHIQGVRYGLGFCKQHNAIVLLEIDDLGALSESKWLWAWDKGLRIWNTGDPYMFEIGGEIALLVGTWWDRRVVVLVLDKESGEGWSWRKVSTLPEQFGKQARWWPFFHARDCCTHGNLTFLFIDQQVVVFDSQRLTWEFVGKHLWYKTALLVRVPDFTAVPNVNNPSEELRRRCASRFQEANFYALGLGSTFSKVEALSRRGMSWQRIGEVAVDRNKGGEFRQNCVF